MTNEPDIKEIQKKLLEILLYFQQFCKEHDLKFTLAGGTCLGAVRHGGFIPWDDDLDVFMPREDYDKLPELWAKYADTERYSCHRSNADVNIHHSATEIKDNNTTFINKHSVDMDINHGVMIDVIPLDGVADNGVSRIHQICQGMIYDCFNFQRLPNHKNKVVYYATKVALDVVKSPKTRYQIWKAAENQHTKYSITTHDQVASFGEGLGIMMQRFPKEWFLHPVMLEFEGHKMPVPADPYEYLEISYGDYMKLPPKEERVFRHDLAFVDLSKSYKNYRGVKYCVNQNKAN